MCVCVGGGVRGGGGGVCVGGVGVGGGGEAPTITNSWRLRKYKVLRNLRHYLRAENQGHHTIDRLGMRGVERGSAGYTSLTERERATIKQTHTGTVSKATLGKLLRDSADGAHFGFSERLPIATIVKCSEQN